MNAYLPVGQNQAFALLLRCATSMNQGFVDPGSLLGVVSPFDVMY